MVAGGGDNGVGRDGFHFADKAAELVVAVSGGAGKFHPALCLRRGWQGVLLLFVQTEVFARRARAGGRAGGWSRHHHDEYGRAAFFGAREFFGITEHEFVG